MKENSVYWLRQLRGHTEFGKYRFKRLDKGFKGYPPFEFDSNILDVVNLQTFIKVEEDRIPLFVGTQFGIYPWFNDFPDFYSEERTIAVLEKSVLSGHVAGLGIYKVNAFSKHSDIKKDCVIFFNNEN